MLVNSIILPRLEETLSMTKPILETTDCQPNQSIRKVSTAECFDIIEKEFVLRRYAVKMLSMLFRSRTGDGESRHHFIELLQSVTTSTPYGIRDWVHQREREDPEVKSLAEGFIAEELNLRFEAIRQLEICLGAPFSSLPHTHGNVPDILKALCDTARFYSIDYEEDAEHKMGETHRLLMTLASILPLARLSCARNANAMLMSRQHVTQIPEDIMSIISVDEWLHNINPMVLNETLPIVSEENDFNLDHGDIAPFVFVKHHGNGKVESQSSQNSSKQARRRQIRRHGSDLSINGKQGTIVDFEPVASVIKHVLGAVACGPSARHSGERTLLFDRTISPSSLTQLPSILCTICYTVISDFLSHGMAFPGMDDLLWLDLDSSPDKINNENELISRSQAVTDFAGLLGHTIVSHVGDEENRLLLGRKLCDVLVHLSMSKCQKVVQNACCGLISILSSLRHSFGEKRAKGNEVYDAAISDCLVSFIEHVCLVLRGGDRSYDQVLIPLIDGMFAIFAVRRLCKHFIDSFLFMCLNFGTDFSLSNEGSCCLFWQCIRVPEVITTSSISNIVSTYP